MDTHTQPLSDLHRHLDGSLRPETLAALAEATGGAIPADLTFRPGMGLADALTRFAVTLSMLQTADAVQRVAREMCEDAAAEGVTTLEIRFAPQLHRNAPPEQIVDAALDGVSGRAGLILCGLYGEDPSVLDRLVSIAATRLGVVGIDLAGGPIPGAPSLRDYAAPFRRAESLGIGRTVHAAEGRPPHEIRTAIEMLGAQRIGHGTTLLDDPTIVDLVLARGVTVEACITSNVHTGAIRKSEDHPLPTWLSLGINACVCADNTLLSDTNAITEHRLAASLPGMTPSLFVRTLVNGHAAAFRR